MLVTTPAVARVRTGAATRTSHTLHSHPGVNTAFDIATRHSLNALEGSGDMMTCMHACISLLVNNFLTNFASDEAAAKHGHEIHKTRVQL